MEGITDLRQLAVAVAVYEKRSVSEAAKRLSMSQPAVSRTLAKLRRLFSDELFVKAGLEMVPSPKGRALAASARRLLDQARPEKLVPAKFDLATTNTAFTLAMSELLEVTLFPAIAKTILCAAPGSSV